MIQDTLKELGLKDKEILVYLEIMRLGKTTPARIALITKINRATVYSVIETLISKGLIAEDSGAKIKYIYALPPKDLNVLIRKEEEILEKKQELVKQAINELKDLPLNTQYAIPHVRLLDETQLEAQLREGVERWEQSMQKADTTNTWWGFQDHTFAEHFKDWIEWYWTRAPKNIQLKLLTNESGIEEEMKKLNLQNREVKLISGETAFTATTWVLGEYLLMIYANARPFYAIEIHNPVMAHNHRELFKNIWEKY